MYKNLIYLSNTNEKGPLPCIYTQGEWIVVNYLINNNEKITNTN